MKALVLVAGFGRRMRPISDTTHKSLLTIAGRTLLARIVDGLGACGVRDVVVVTGYRAREIEDHLRATFPDRRFEFVHNERYAETNNIFSMALAFEHMALDDDLLLVESDLVCEPEVFARLVDSPHPNVALVDHYRSGMDGTVVTVEQGMITSVIPPHLQHGDFSFVDKYKTLNVYKFSREFCSTTFKQLLTYYARVIDDNCYYELILGILIYMRQVQVAAEILDGERWAEVDDPNDLRAAEFLLDPRRRQAILDDTKGGWWSFPVLDFAYLRNMYYPTPAMLAAIRDSLPALLHNYGSSQPLLDEKLSYFLLARKDRLIALSGAAQLFPMLARRYAGRRVHLPQPTFNEFVAAFPGFVAYVDHGSVDPAAIPVQPGDVVVFVNPNNPSGTTLGTDALFAFAAANPAVQIIVDESFLRFSDQPSIVERLDRDALPNVLVLASLSKTLGVPGARLGWAYSADPELVASLRRELPIWNLNSVAEYLLELMLKHKDTLAASFVRTAADREQLAAALAAIPGVERVFPSGGNFLLVRIAGSAAAVTAALLERESILVKDATGKLDDGHGYLRLAVRLPDENRRMCSALARALADGGR
jgi:histidinol-phosphate/aromatic aminotransferase/cobyric acid decarboxylase-like protein/choline kinase